MPARRWMLSVLVALVLWPAVAHGQSAALIDAYQRFLELYAQGRYQEALPFAEEALRLNEHEDGACSSSASPQALSLAPEPGSKAST